jgi:L-histidine Nalpha-methyltransferase
VTASRKDPDPVPTLDVVRCLPPGFLADSLRADARAGLTASPKQLPPKWFYDERGSELFEEITRLPEYYPTRAERDILRAAAPEIAAASRAETLVELGSGSSEKTRLLLDALTGGGRGARDGRPGGGPGTLRLFVPVDVSESALIAAGRAVLDEYAGLAVRAVVSDFEEHLGLAVTGDGAGPGADGTGGAGGADGSGTGGADGGARLVAFLGGTIGNLFPAQRAAFLARLRREMRSGDALLLGTDLVKDPGTLVAAYDDAAGITAAFNKNVLAVLNRELDADFDPGAFSHVAVWDAGAEWIEMRLRSKVAQTVKLPAIGLLVSFEQGEEMRTEVSAKFRRDGIAAELAAAGFAMRHWWSDRGGRYGLSLSAPV